MALDSDEEHAARYRVQHLEHEIGVLESAKTDVHDRIKLYHQRMDEAKTIKDTLTQDILLCAATIRRLPSPILSVQNLYSFTEEETRTRATKYELTCQLLAMNAEGNMLRAQSDLFRALKCISEDHHQDIDGILENLKQQKDMA
ncbi:hypothetical protein KJ359_008564 [Pestalotiopsis sp. 9143b]|nr:hypothetical protein KJ359_008564 [Pestalotiopsis sp. 9143b]